MNRKLYLGFVAASLAVGILALPWAASARPAGGAAKDLFQSLKRYAGIRSIHFIAHAAIWLAPHDDQPELRGDGEFEYWAAGDRYRVQCVTPRHLGLAADAEVAFDGDRRQLFDRESGQLIIKSGDDPRLPIALPNPLFLPLEFLNPETDTCRLCATRMTDLQNPRFWDHRTETARPIDTLIADAKGPLQYDVDGAVLLGARLSYRVVFGSMAGRPVPLRVTRFSSDDSRLDIKTSHFEVGPSRSGGPAYSKRSPEPRSKDDGPLAVDSGLGDVPDSEVGPIPLRIDMAGYDYTGKKVSNVTFTINVIDLNWKTDERIFKIDEKQAKVVWDGDEHVFTKHYNPAVVNQKMLVPR